LFEKLMLLVLRRTETHFQRHGRMAVLSGLTRQDLRQRRSGGGEG